MFLKQLVKGEDYSKLEKIITINLIDFNIDNSNYVLDDETIALKTGLSVEEVKALEFEIEEKK